MSKNLYESQDIKEIRESLHWLSTRIQDLNTTNLLVRKYLGREDKEDFCKKSLDASLEARERMTKELKNIRSKLKVLREYKDV